MIYFANPRSEYIFLKNKILRAIKKTLNSNNYVLGNEVLKFENEFKKYIGTKYAIGVSSGTDALILSLKTLNIKKGDEIIAPSHTAYATIASIVEVGAIPVFVDVNYEDFLMKIEDVKKKITKKTKAVIAVHLYGNSVDIKSLRKVLNSKIKIVEDCSQSHGSVCGNIKSGSIGDLSCFSLYPTKNLSSFGDGGIVLTNNSKLYNKLKLAREYGWRKKNIGKFHAVNNRLDELHASILNIKLKYLEKFNQRRIKIANQYLKKIKNENIILPIKNKKNVHVYHLFVIKILYKKRDRFLKFMKKRKIIPGIHYIIPNHKQKPYLKYCNSDLKNTEKLSKEIVSLPIYPLMKKKEINHIINSINLFK